MSPKKTHTETNTPPNTTPLLQVVQCENKYRPLVESLLYKTAFAEDAAQVETLQKTIPTDTFYPPMGK
ncbi:MAG: hypothetical protein H6554_09705 [Chitinophagales bacterium]|nr:hypothetical protein [Chitinophagales bacterium]